VQMRTQDNILDVLVGEQLSAVSFVQDYVELHFDGRALTAYTTPVVSIGIDSARWGEPGYRDMLCGRIAHIVRSAVATEGEQISIELDDDSVIFISLRYEHYAEGQVEAAMFVDSITNPELLAVWN